MSIQGSRFFKLLLAVVCGSAALLMSGCASHEFPPSGSDQPHVVAAREEAAAEQDALLAKAVMGERISVSVNDNCRIGTYSEPWGPRDNYYWQCVHTTSWVVGSDLVDAGELIEGYRAHLSETGCEPDAASFDQAARYWAMYGVTGQNVNGEPYTVDSLPGAGARCPDGTHIGIGFRSSAAFDVSKYVTFYASDGEEIESRPHDQVAIRTSGSELVVALSTSTTYHDVPRDNVQRSSETTPEPFRCACYSGSECDCPGG